MEVNRTSYQFKDLLDKAKKILVLIGGEPTTDLVSAGLATSEILKSLGKTAHLVSAHRIPDTATVISGIEEIRQDLESKNLVISLDYEKTPIEKVSYKIEGKTFNLIVKPRKSINIDEIHTSFTGGDYNLVIILGTSDIGKLSVYGQHRDLFESLPTINIDINEANTRFGKLNIVDSKIGSISALLSILFDEAKVNLTEKSANLLMLGIRDATNNFMNIRDSRIFEAAAYTSKSKEDSKAENEEIITEKSNNDLPEDWLSPKVYRSSKVS